MRDPDFLPDDRRGRPTNEAFVNPYNFIPLPARKIVREPPPSHAALTGCCGRIELELTFATPWFTPDPHGLEEGERQHRYARLLRTHDGRGLLPGSGLKGAVRAVAEVLSASCLLILTDSRFSWRPQKGTVSQRGAIVRELPEPAGQPGRLELCDVYKVSFDLLGEGHFDGQELAAQVDPVRGHVTRLGAGQTRGILKVTEVVGKKGTQRFFVPNGTTQDLTVAMVDAYHDGLAPGLAVDARAVGFRQVKGRDQRFEYRAIDHRTRNGRTVQADRRKRHRLVEDDLVYVRDINGEAVIGPVELFRVVFAQSVRSATPAQHHPCTDPERLCPACRLFGWAPAEGRDLDEDRATGYRGRVRCGPLVTKQAIQDEDTRDVTLPPLGQPHASAAAFYLDRPSRGEGAAAWSDAQLRVRGRKRYWQQSNAQGDPLGVPWDTRHGGQPEADNQNRTVELVRDPAAHPFQGVIVFENLSPEELGLLLAALDPTLLGNRLLGDRVPRHQLGGGKPLGLGRVGDVRLGVTLDDPAERYGSLAAAGERRLSDEDLLGYVRRWAAAMTGRPTNEATAALRDYAEIDALLTMMDVAQTPGPVRYPPGPPDKPEESFRWFVELAPGGEPQRRGAETLHTVAETAAGQQQSPYQSRQRRPPGR